MEMSIRRSTDRKAIRVLLFSAIEFVAENYTSATNLSKELLKECTDFVLDQFAFLGVEEIKQAFRLAASSETTVDLNTYHGRFNVNILGKALNAYKEYRQPIVKLIFEQQEIENADAQKLFWQSPKGQALIQEKLAERVRHLRAYPGAVSAKDYDLLTTYGFFSISDEKKRRLLAIANWQIQRDKKSGNVDFSELASDFPELLQVRVKNRAKRLAVMSYIHSLNK